MEVEEREAGTAVQQETAHTAVQTPPILHRRLYLLVKRAQDILLSLLALTLLSPLLLLIALAVVLDDPHGGPIFTQVRCGRNGEAFHLYKFRTMCMNAEAQLDALLPYNEMTGPVFKIRNDPRITRLGRFLRAARSTSTL